jgi:hypothetical protein
VGIDPRYGYFRLGTEQAGNLHTWRAAVVMQAERVREALAAPDDAGDRRDANLRLDADAHFLLVAIRSGLRFAERVQAVVNDVRLGEALTGFADQFPYAHDLRDVLTHLDEYVLDQGHLQPAGKGKRKGEVAAGSSSWRVVIDGDVVLMFGPFSVRLLAVAAVAEHVLDLAAEAWWRGLQEGADELGRLDDPELWRR